jgi:multidrug efflux system membrane fusion protein
MTDMQTPPTEPKRKSGFRISRVRSTLIALIIAAAAAAWIGSGYLGGNWNLSGSPDGIEAARANAAPKAETPTRVRVKQSVATEYIASIEASGQTEAARSVEIRAETEGRVVEINAREGAMVNEGDVLIRLDHAERDAEIDRAKARLRQRRIEFNAASKLASEGFQSQTRRAEAEADLEAARADLKVYEIDLARTEIAAPFSGVLDTRPVEIGDFVQRGDPVATIVEIDPLLVVSQIAENNIAQIQVGMPVTARLARGPDYAGVIVYKSAIANEQTRTFKVEAELSNADRRIAQGMTAEMRIDLPAVQAHLVPPSIFQLDQDGRVGLMIVDDRDVARFLRVDIIGSNAEGAFVTGLPDTARIVMVGQQLIEDGETVVPVRVDESPEAVAGAAS